MKLIKKDESVYTVRFSTCGNCGSVGVEYKDFCRYFKNALDDNGMEHVGIMAIYVIFLELLKERHNQIEGAKK